VEQYASGGGGSGGSVREVKEKHRKLPPSYKNARRRRPFRIVHASVRLTGFGCPPEMIRLAISIHPDQVQEMDEEGNLPLHIACTAPPVCFLGTGATTTAATLDTEDDCSTVFSFLSTSTVVTTNPFDKVMQLLLQHYPAAVRIPHGQSGRLPLILAWDRRTWEDGIRTLLDAFPAALECYNKLHLGLYPTILHLLLSTKANNTNKYRGRTSVFELLKAKPGLFIRE